MTRRRDRARAVVSPQKNRVSAAAIAGMWIVGSAAPLALPASAIAEIPW
ncbi:MAG: hypothetical protein IH987_16435 [Planctomycetes bacterium]|nr:hypothetical protein [Planctomycetota bacterium]